MEVGFRFNDNKSLFLMSKQFNTLYNKFFIKSQTILNNLFILTIISKYYIIIKLIIKILLAYKNKKIQKNTN